VKRVNLVLLLTCLLSIFPTQAEIKSGDYLFLSAKLLDCPELLRLLDYAQVTNAGEAKFLNGIKVNALNKTYHQLIDSIAKEVGKQQENIPTTIEIVIVPEAKSRTVATFLTEIADRADHNTNICQLPENWQYPAPIKKNEYLIAKVSEY